MLCKSSKWELGFVHYIAKFTISRFIIARFECNLKNAMMFMFTIFSHQTLQKALLDCLSLTG